VDRFDALLPASQFRQVRRGCLVLVEAGDGMNDLLADQRAAGVEAVAADPCDLPDVREVDVLRAGDPEGAADDPAVALVQFRVIGVAGAAQGSGVFLECPYLS
jgi:hypothetical protein